MSSSESEDCDDGLHFILAVFRTRPDALCTQGDVGVVRGSSSPSLLRIGKGTGGCSSPSESL